MESFIQKHMEGKKGVEEGGVRSVMRVVDLGLEGRGRSDVIRLLGEADVPHL